MSLELQNLVAEIRQMKPRFEADPDTGDLPFPTAPDALTQELAKIAMQRHT